MQSNVSQEHYVAFIYMPKNNITFATLSFIVQGEDLDGLLLDLTNDDSKLNIFRDEGEGGFDDENIQRQIYSTSSRPTASVYKNIDTNKLDALSEGVSMFDIINLEDVNKDLYLTKGDKDIYTYKNDGIVLTVSFSSEKLDRKPYTVTEFMAEWS